MTKRLPRSKRKLTYHGRSGYPVVHETKTGRDYIMVRKRDGGTKRLYLKYGQVPKEHVKPVKHRR